MDETDGGWERRARATGQVGATGGGWGESTCEAGGDREQRKAETGGDGGLRA